MKLPTTALLSLVLALGPRALAIPPATDPASAGPSCDEASLAGALDAIRADSIRADLHFLAADELGGRDTPGHGLRLAARFLRARVQRLGFRPAGNDGFFATFEAERVVADLSRTAAVARRGEEERALVFGADYYFWGGDADLEVSGPLVFVGRASASEVVNVSLEGCWALAYTSEEVGWRERRGNVRARGARGLLLLPGAREEPGDFARNAERMTRRRRGGLRVPEAVWPMSYLSPALGEWLLPRGAATPVGTRLEATWRETRALSPASERFTLENVAALWPGSDPALAKEVILLSAHYDHVGARDGMVWNGADDNGSGTVGLLAVADALAREGPLRRSVLLLWVSGEEKGLLGSGAWARNPTLAEGYHAVLDINLDMIGRNAPDALQITPTQDHEAHNGLTRLVEELAPAEGFGPLGNADRFWNRSDQASFRRHLGIPVVFLFTGLHEDYHEPTDTEEKIDYDKIRRVSRLVVRMLGRLQGDSLEL